MGSIEIISEESPGGFGDFGLSKASRQEIINAAHSAAFSLHEDESPEYADHVQAAHFPMLIEALCGEILEAETPERKEAAVRRLGISSKLELGGKYELVESTLETALTDDSSSVRQAAEVAIKSILSKK